MNTFPAPIEEARVLLSRFRPHISPLTFSLLPVEVKKEEAPDWFVFGIDARGHLLHRTGGEGLEKFTPQQLAFGVFHEILHLLLGHFGRDEPFKALYPPEFLNVCMDLEVNDLLINQDGAFPPIHDKLATPDAMGVPRNKTFEEYVELLKDKIKFVEVVGMSPRFGPQWERTSPSRGKGKGKITIKTSPQKLPSAGTETGMSPGRLQNLSNYIASELAKDPDDTPGYLNRWANSLLTPLVPWKSVLRGYLSRLCAIASGWKHITYRKPRRRGEALDPFLLPTYYDSPLTLAAVIDTSGSMGDSDLARALSEVGALLKQTGYPIWALACDTEATPPVKVAKPEQFRLIGGGGTDMGAGIARACAIQPKPDIVVVLTDGHTDWPDAHPGVPTLVVTIHSNQPGPPWANGHVRIPAP